MNIDIRTLIGETTTYDKKEKVEKSKPKSWLKSVAAFANGEGGVLVFGISDNDEIVGLQNAEKEFLKEGKEFLKDSDEFTKEFLKEGKEFLKDSDEFTKEFTKEDLKFRKEFLKAQRMIYGLISTKPGTTIKEMAEHIGISDRQIRKYIKKLTELKLIAREGGRKNGKWRIIDEEYENFFDRI